MKTIKDENIARLWAARCRCGATVLLLLATVTWAPAAGAAPMCYANRYQVKTAGEVFDAATGLTWQQAVDAASYDLAGAQTRCSGIWRLPSLTELQTIADLTKTTPPLIDLTAFPGTPAGYYWTSTPKAGFAGNSWFINFTAFAATYGPNTDARKVRCVR